KHHKLKLSSGAFQELIAVMAPEWRLLDDDGGLVLISPTGDSLHFFVKTAVDKVEEKMKAMLDAIDRGDVDELARLNRGGTGRTYRDVVKPYSKEEQQLRI